MFLSESLFFSILILCGISNRKFQFENETPECKSGVEPLYWEQPSALLYCFYQHMWKHSSAPHHEQPLGTYSFPYWMYGSPRVGSSHSVMLFEHLSSSALTHLQKCYPGGWRLLWHIVARKKHLKHTHIVCGRWVLPLYASITTGRDYTEEHKENTWMLLLSVTSKPKHPKMIRIWNNVRINPSFLFSVVHMIVNGGFLSFS